VSNKVSDEDIEKLYAELKKNAQETGYHLNPDEAFVKDLVRGLIENEDRYGYASCPCRLASLSKDVDIDIICPCDYRDADLNEYGACYCALYVSERVLKGEKELTQIPERRLPYPERKKSSREVDERKMMSLSHPVWRCRVCGYLCAREEPPDTCPICKAKKERFERFL
jgi:ferredoxin-thioredoxin reductase catalytic chain